MSQINLPPQMVKHNVSQLQERFKSKNELYKFLTQECGIYLPKNNCTNIYFLKDIMTGKKEVSFPYVHVFTLVVCFKESRENFSCSLYYGPHC